jgi:hypothetical protein
VLVRNGKRRRKPQQVPFVSLLHLITIVSLQKATRGAGEKNNDLPIAEMREMAGGSH